MLKLHLGAFDQILPGWVNTDITPHLYVARIPGLPRLITAAGLMTELRLEQHRAGIFRQLRKMNATKAFPFRNGSVDAIYTSHMLTTLTRRNAARCLAECRRVLKPGSILRISIVDLDEAVRSYDPALPDEFVDLMFDLETSTHPKNRQWWHYNETSLGAALRTAGFREWHRCEYRQGRCPDVESVDCRPESLFMEAVK